MSTILTELQERWEKAKTLDTKSGAYYAEMCELGDIANNFIAFENMEGDRGKRYLNDDEILLLDNFMEEYNTNIKAKRYIDDSFVLFVNMQRKYNSDENKATFQQLGEIFPILSNKPHERSSENNYFEAEYSRLATKDERREFKADVCECYDMAKHLKDDIIKDCIEIELKGQEYDNKISFLFACRDLFYFYNSECEASRTPTIQAVASTPKQSATQMGARTKELVITDKVVLDELVGSVAEFKQVLYNLLKGKSNGGVDTAYIIYACVQSGWIKEKPGRNEIYKWFGKESKSNFDTAYKNILDKNVGYYKNKIRKACEKLK